MIGISIPAFIIYKVMTIPSKIKMILPKDSDLQTDPTKSIVISIDKNEDFFINNKKTQLAKIISQLDSLGQLGYNDTTIILDADKSVMISKVVQVMNLAKETERKIIIKTNPKND